MVGIRNFFTNMLIARQAARGGVATALFANTGANKGPVEPPPAARTIHDTVTLSGGGQKIVNLARGGELAKEIRAAPLDKDFAASLLKAQEDIFRINRLFSETIKTAFQERQR